MLDDADAPQGPELGSVGGAVRPPRRPLRPRPGRLATGSAASAGATPAAPRGPAATPAQTPPKSQDSEETVDRPMSRMERRRAARAAEAARAARREAAAKAEQQRAAQDTRALQEARAAERARAAKQAERRRAAERAKQAELARQAERALAAQEAEERRAAERARLAELARQADLAEQRRAAKAAKEAAAKEAAAAAARAAEAARKARATKAAQAAREAEAARAARFEREAEAARAAAVVSELAPATEPMGLHASAVVAKAAAPEPSAATEPSSGSEPTTTRNPFAAEAKPRPAFETADQPVISETLPLVKVPGLQESLEQDELAAKQAEASQRRRSRSAQRTAVKTPQGALALPRLGRRAKLWASLVLLILAVVWLLLAVMTSSTVSAQTRCSGVEIGGMSRTEAIAALEQAYAEKLAAPLTVSADGATAQLSGAAVKAKVDGERSTRGLTGFTLSPLTIAKRLIGGQQSTVVITADPEAVRAELSNHLEELSHGAVSAQVSLVDGKVQQTPAVAGIGVDVEAATTKLAAFWPVDATSAVTLPEGVTEPAVTDAEAQAFTSNVLEPLLAGPVTLTVAGTEAEGRASTRNHELSAAEITNLATVKEKAGALCVELEPTKLREEILQAFGSAIETQAAGTKWQIDGSEAGAPTAKPELVSAAPGKVVDGAEVSKAIVDGVSKSGASAATRTITLQLKDDAASATGDASTGAALGIKEIVGSSDTPFESDPQRDQNLRVGAAAVNGTLILPGQSYSMSQTIGEVTTAKGYTDAGVIIGAKHVNDIGGGLSQVTTTVFNAAFAAGMEDDEHTPHSQYMSRYPAGLEATLWTGQIDMRFTNSTPYGVLLQAWVGQGQVHVRAWSTRYYDVEVSTSDKFNVVRQGSTHSSGPDCVPNPEGQPGFDITVTRKRSLNGSALPTEVRTVHYEPNNSVSCG
ncbi:Uncharacterized vancomycin resistance protein [Actinomyces bovis]|uniref:Uncharacterized vancomycin resistance protein n=1 Tax=Actinomyces bovis TaxID=1658 RepID=A0ABY1VM85_9ACTO|nr:VanW family protein [Actinomyces bovis]SPT53221.1 Uncharacterized vancomycin resistance protein [Actinomyces bovis]VEG52457.1 Uncharacterized vancomycin resistance protein [Actinomyces israelii]